MVGGGDDKCGTAGEGVRGLAAERFGIWEDGGGVIEAGGGGGDLYLFRSTDVVLEFVLDPDATPSWVAIIL